MQTTFENYDKSVRSYLSKTFNSLGLDYTPNQIFGTIYEGIKGVIQNAMFYIEDAMTEQNIYTAVRKKSFYSLAKQSGYEPFYGSAATGIININSFIQSETPGKMSGKIYINDNTLLVNSGTNLQYTIMLPMAEYVIDITKPLKTHQFKVVQGYYSNATFVANGQMFETFSIDTSGMFDKEYTKVFVNGELWTQAASLYDMTSTDKQYMITVGFDNTFDIVFGNGVHGMKLNESDNIEVRYFIHNGEQGNITEFDNSTFTFISPCYNAYGNTVSAEEFLTISMNSPISGGTDADTVDLVRKMIGYNSRSLVLANEDNYKMFLKRFSFVGQTSIFCNEGSTSVTASCLSSKKDSLDSPEDYLNLSINELMLSDNEKQIIMSSLKNSNKTFIGSTFKFVDPIVCRYAMMCYVKANTVYNKETLNAAIRNTVASYFMNLPENTKFIAKSDIIKAVVDNVSNIDAFDFDFISNKNEEAFKNGFYNEYVIKNKNGEYMYVPIKRAYDNTSTPGLDGYGNIVINSNLEIPILNGGFSYYPNKSKNDKTTSIRVNAVETLFI